MKRLFITIGVFAMLVLTGCGWNPFGPGDGGEIRPPTPIYPQFDDSPCFSPDGSTIVFYHVHVTYIDSSEGAYDVDLDSTGLWFINPDGTNKRMFLNLTEWSAGSPDWSPDGEWLAFDKGARIWKIKVNGDSLTQLTFNRRTFFPDWSPDGKKIAYDQSISTVTHPRGIWIMDADGSNDHLVIDYGRCPDWSPDGSKIAYNGIYVADTNGTNIELIHEGGSDPGWSPDGSEIAFSSGAIGEVPQIWVMKVDGSNPCQLTTRGGFTPAWSPNGEKIVYCQYDAHVYNPRENGTLWIMDADGSNKRQLTFGLDEPKESNGDKLPKRIWRRAERQEVKNVR